MGELRQPRSGWNHRNKIGEKEGGPEGRVRGEKGRKRGEEEPRERGGQRGRKKLWCIHKRIISFLLLFVFLREQRSGEQ